MSDIYIVDAEYYILVSGAGELVQNPGAGDVETPVREAARGNSRRIERFCLGARRRSDRLSMQVANGRHRPV